MSASSPITSRRNRRIVEARKLAMRKHRQRQGCFLVEGLPLLAMALASGARPQEVFYCQEQLVDGQSQALVERLRAAGAEPVAVSAEVMGALAEREEPEGIVATFPLHDRQLVELETGERDLVVVLDRLQDPGNLGTLIRTADAVAAAAVIVIEPSVDPFDPKTVRGTMGSIFNVPLARTDDVPGLFAFLDRRGLRAIGAHAHHGRAWGEGLWQRGAALILGNEARGLSEDVAAHVQEWARLPIAGRAESLNVAVAGGVLMYGWLRANL